MQIDGQPRTLTGHQFDLLWVLARNAGRVMSREALMDRLKGQSLEAFDRSIDVHISRIRAAIEDDPKHPKRVITIRGTGYLYLLALTAEEGARADGSVSGVSVRVKGDPRMLRRMVRNLFDNAQRHGHGTLIEATVEALDGGGARLLVEDQGPGVPEEEREKIFEPFYRPAGMREGADGGVGLGLALVRQIARHHHGEACCLERVGGGTRLEITLGACRT